jgi:SSS family solute:Na+ symporter
MSASVIALTFISGIVGIGSFIGFYAGSRRKMDLEQWIVGDRGFGMLLVWLLTAGEIYTTFTFLGASGWAYSKGGPVLYILAYQPLMNVVAFFILPQVWEVGRKHRLQTQADFFHVRYNNKYLAAFVALVGVVCIIPYLQLQLTGLGMIVEVASYGVIHRTPAMILAFVIVAAFVLTSGIRGVAWVSVLKDLLLLFAAVFVGIAIPYIYFGGIGRMFAALARSNPSHLVMPGATSNLGHSWYISTVVLVSVGFYMWPQFFGASFSAKSSDTLRRNAVVMPFYSITMPLMFFVGLAATLVLPGLANGDLALLSMVRKTFPPWFLGVIGGAGALTAMVPAGVMILTAATLFAKNMCRPILFPGMSDQQVGKLAKITVLVITVAALCSAIYSSTTLVYLLLMGYGGVGQFFPGVVLGLYSKRVTMAGVFSGIVTGVCIFVPLVLLKRDPIMGLNAGFVALCCNFAVVAVVSLLGPAKQPLLNEAATATSGVEGLEVAPIPAAR